ncbi:SDR family oxidoreductase [Streptomyces sp. NPDC006552]|uniref:SDR family oxidoreductase n=1 Tax=Streptomyces sp. NPDC006552 TaxID=3157179 RepID=UPI0033B93235
MKVFVTGASGWIGSALAADLIAAGHTVSGLARSDASAKKLVAAGVEPVRGSLDDLDVLREAARAADGVAHLAFDHDKAFTGGDFRGAVEADRRAVSALGEGLAGTGRPFVAAGGTPAAPGTVTTEHDARRSSELGPEDNGPAARAATDALVLALAERQVRSSVVRLPRTNHGEGDAGFIAMLVATAREKGVSGYIGDGANRWPAVHRLDSAHAFRLALEKAPAGSVLHAVADEGVAIRDIAEVIGRHLGMPTASVAPQDAFAHFGWVAAVLAPDQPSSAELTRKLIGWEPTRPGLLADLDQGHYFRQAS